MKKTLVILLVILLAPVLIFGIIDRNDDYSAEKSLWKLNKDYQEVAKDPKAAPPASFDQLANKYEKLMKRYSTSKIIPIAKVYYGRVYAVRGDYGKARQVFEEIIRENSDNMIMITMAFRHIIQTYAAEEDFKNVVNTYERIKKEYPISEIGIRAPLDIARMYAVRKEEIKKNAAISAALDYYKGLLAQEMHPTAKMMVMRFQSECYFSLGDWDSGIDTLRDLLIDFPEVEYLSVERARWIISTINAMSAGRLKDYDRPVAIYTEFVEKYPEHPYRKVFEQVIIKIKEAKAASIAEAIKDK